MELSTWDSLLIVAFGGVVIGLVGVALGLIFESYDKRKLHRK